jgi:hypothetical protein
MHAGRGKNIEGSQVETDTEREKEKSYVKK